MGEETEGQGKKERNRSEKIIERETEGLAVGKIQMERDDGEAEGER